MKKKKREKTLKRGRKWKNEPAAELSVESCGTEDGPGAGDNGTFRGSRKTDEVRPTEPRETGADSDGPLLLRSTDIERMLTSPRTNDGKR